eukprot:6199864-Pleurochrysis_carterae.AAC.1
MNIPSRAVQAVDYGVLARGSLCMPVPRVCRPPHGPRQRYKHIAGAFMTATFKGAWFNKEGRANVVSTLGCTC